MTALNLFTYGTLLCEDIMLQVAGKQFARIPGTITGYNRYRIKGETYPGLIAEEGSSIEGMLYQNITAAAWERLGRFEGEMYEKVTVPVDCGERVLPATVYVLRPAFAGLLEKKVWSFHTFLKRVKVTL